MIEEIESGWSESRIEKYINKCEFGYSSYLENLSDKQGEILYRTLSFSLRFNLFQGESEESEAVEMWQELNKIFGGVQW